MRARSLWPHALLILMALALAMAPRRAHAVDDPALEYETLTTTHFTIHYARGLDDLARRVALTSEEAHTVLTPLLDWQPASRTHIFVSDRLDTANGSAQIYGRNTINFYGMPPESDSVLGYYDDWIRILVYHEYVHILHLDTTRRLPALFNRFVGKLYNPNQFLPRWYIEGLATYYESARTGTGRVNSSLYKMWLRAEMLKPGRPLSLAQASNATSRWPFGSVVYLFGSFFLDWIARRHGEIFFTDFNHTIGGRVLPYGMNQAAKKLTGETFDQMWDLWTAEERARARSLQDAVRARGETALQFLTTRGGESKFPRVRPGHEAISFHLNDLSSHPTFATLDARSPHTASPDSMFEVDAAAGSSAWTPDGKRLIYSRRVLEENVWRYEDLFLYDTEQKRERRLTHMERAREPAISPDGSRIAYVRNRGGTMELVMRELTRGGMEGEERVLITGLTHPWDDERRWQQIATPSFSPDGKSLVFSWWRMDLRQRDLWLLPLDGADSAKPRPLMRDEAMDLDPHFLPDGTILFSSDRRGVYNIYHIDPKTRETRQVSDVVYGLFSPQLSADGAWIYATTYTARGYDIVRFERPALTPPSSEETTTPRDRSWRKYPPISTRDWLESDYRPIEMLAPLFVFSNFGFLGGGVGGGVNLNGYDPLARHVYNLSLGVAYEPLSQQYQPSFGARYQWNGGLFNVSLNAAHRTYQNSRGLFVQSAFTPFLEKQDFGQLRLTYPLSSTRDSVSLSWSYTADRRDYWSEPDPAFEPGDQEPREPELGWYNEMSVALVYNLLERYPYSVSPERGISATISANLRDPAIGSDYTSLSASYGLFGFLPNPLVRRHALALSVVGGTISSNFRDRLQYSVGGNGPQNVLQSVVFQGGSSSLVVRGYPPSVQRGTKFYLSSLEYRLPIYDLERGPSTAPIFFRQVKGRVFMDMGSAYSGFLADSDMLVGVGGEVLLTTLLGYYLGGTLRAGYARGLVGEDGGNDFYLLWGGGF